MDFRDMFISYKIGRKEINTFFQFTQLPLHRHVAVILLSVWVLVSVLWWCIYNEELTVPALALFGIVVVVNFCENAGSNLKYMQKLYRKHDEKRMKLIKGVLMAYHIDYKNVKTLDLLINEAKRYQNNIFFVDRFSRYHSVSVTLLIAFCSSYIGNVDKIRVDNVIYIMLFFSAFILSVDIVCTSFRDICLLIANGDYYVYEAFIHDLRQVKIFQDNCIKK